MKCLLDILGIYNIKDLLEVIFRSMGLCVAYKGLFTWRDQIRGNNKYKTANKILVSVYKIRNTVETMRRPVLMNLSSREPAKISLEYRELYAPYIESITKLKIELIEYMSEGEVIFGELLKKQLYNLIGILDEFRRAMYKKISIEGMSDDSKEEYKDILQIVNSILNSTENYNLKEKRFDDKFMIKIYDNIEEIKKSLQPHLK